MLPEKWSIKLTDENRGIVNEYMKQILSEPDFKNYLARYGSERDLFNFPNYHDYKGYKGGNHLSSSQRDDYVPITIDQLVINKEPQIINNYSII